MDDPECPPVTLYWGTRTATDLYLHDEIQTWAERLSEFTYTRCCRAITVGADGGATFHLRCSLISTNFPNTPFICAGRRK